MSSDHIRWRTNLSSWRSLKWTYCSLCLQGLWRKRCPIAYTIAVSEKTKFPFLLKWYFEMNLNSCKTIFIGRLITYQRSAESILSTTWSKSWTSKRPLHNLGSIMGHIHLNIQNFREFKKETAEM